MLRPSAAQALAVRLQPHQRDHRSSAHFSVGSADGWIDETFERRKQKG
jgi:hypothetical protein